MFCSRQRIRSATLCHLPAYGELLLYDSLLQIFSKIHLSNINRHIVGSNLCHIVLEDEPHALYVILDIPPVTERVEITKVKAILLTLNNAYDCKGNLAGYEGLASTLALVIEKDA